MYTSLVIKISPGCSAGDIRHY